MNRGECERILAVYRQLLETWNRRDADGFASVFTDDGSCVGFDGSTMNGRAEIASTLLGIFENHPTSQLRRQGS
jgi:uncharacterized protein (TIGR02246 family)